MHQEEMDMVVCDDCGAELALEGSRAYRYSDDGFLCFDCTVRRGGTYDTVHETWMLVPEVSDLPDARRPHP